MYRTGVDSVTVKKPVGRLGAEGEETWRMTTQWVWVFFWGDEQAQTRKWCWLLNIVNVLSTNELYTLKWLKY